jgi:crotonobetainyl-CoA:carnitine CoA-transferase CaiB-like acyl-CoA transferase
VAGSFGRQVGYWANPEQNLGMSVPELQAVVLPRLSQIIDGDSNAALGLFAALALGIYNQARTGEGQFLRTSMIAGNAWAYSDDFCTYDGKPPVALCDDENWGTSALDRLYAAAEDTWVCLAVRSEREFRSLVSVMGMSDVADDERFATEVGRREHDAALGAALAARFRDKPAAAWESALTAADVGCVAVNTDGQPVFTTYDPVLRATGLTVTFEHPLFGEMVRAAPPVAFSETPARVAPPCLRGQHNREILTELGYSETEIGDLEARGAVIAPDTA